eukprot:gene13787-13908_t
MSRRKSPALIGLIDDERVLGEEAFSLAIRYPNMIFSQLRDLLGRSAEDPEVKRLLQENLLPYKVVDNPVRGTCALQVNETTSILVEELVAGIFQYAKQITDAQAGESVVDAVVTVPAWYGVAQRQALIDAASLAGLNVLALMNTHSAAALQYGIERDFAKKEQLVVLYDMGSGSTEAALVKYSTYGKAGSTAKALTNQFEVLDMEWDNSLGSNTLDLLLADHFAADFKSKGGADVKSFPKAMAKLRRQVRRTKEILSANTAAPISVEELHGGMDFQSSIKREEFEALAGSFWERAAAVLTKLLKRNKLTGKDVDAVELLGGGSRVPLLQSVLTDALGGRHLDRHLDADEAIVLGAGLFAANLSSSFRLRKFGMTDIAAFGITFESHDLFLPVIDSKAASGKDSKAKDKKKGKDAKKASKAVADVEDVEVYSSTKSGHVLKNLLPAGKKLPIKRAVKYNNLTIDGFSFELRYNSSTTHGLPPGVSDPLLAAYTVSGITSAVQRYNHSGTTSLRFEADYSGLLHFSNAECLVELDVVEDLVIEVGVGGDLVLLVLVVGVLLLLVGVGVLLLVLVTVPEVVNITDSKNDTAAGEEPAAADQSAAKNQKGPADGKKGDSADTAKGKTGSANDADGTKEADGAANATTADVNATSPTNRTILVKKTIQVPRRKTFHVVLNVTGAGPRFTPLSGDALREAQAHLAAWRAAETVKAATAKAKNDLEAYIISTREKLETEEGLQQVTSEESRVAFTEQLTAAEDWLYGDGETEGAEAFKSKLKDLKAVGDPMARRAAELDLRPQVLSAVKEQLDVADKLIASWAEGKPWITEEETKGASEKVEDFKKWLQEQEDAQAKKQLTEEPAFASADVIGKWEVLQKALKKVDGKRQPKPPPAAKNATSADATGDEPSQGSAGKKEADDGKSKAKKEDTTQQQQQKQTADSVDEELPVHEEL